MSGKVLVIGRIGQVGHELARAAWPAGFAPEFVERDQLDLGNPDEVKPAVVAMRPRIVINAGAYTAVDQAESERDAAFAVNRDGPAALAEACREVGAALIHFSTDYVFDGTKPSPYTEDDPVNPLSAYGASKAAGASAIAERLRRHVILRTSWVYSAVGHNFVKTMLRLGAERDELRIVDDQHGAPTAAAELARAAIHIAAALDAGREDGYGIFNFTGAGATTWYGFARAIFAGAAERGAKGPLRVQPIATEDYPLPAPRPRNSRLDCGKIARTYGLAAKSWQDSLSDCLDELIGPALRLRSAQGGGR
ncbi:MAG TPA: dTDP-4-dehydrorhamnose reductase [Stellaceae bacterium]|nr:dTDP-4-dehydrorhamnose reductase [Stellaceae bacterium]